MSESGTFRFRLMFGLGSGRFSILTLARRATYGCWIDVGRIA